MAEGDQGGRGEGFDIAAGVEQEPAMDAIDRLAAYDEGDDRFIASDNWKAILDAFNCLLVEREKATARIEELAGVVAADSRQVFGRWVPLKRKAHRLARAATNAALKGLGGGEEPWSS